MAKYGLDYYGIGKYGSGQAAVVDYDASPVVATSTGYRQIKVTWNPPSGGWSRVRLVRNTYGIPLTVDDGTVVYDEARGSSQGIYTDNGEIPNNIGLRPGISYHYSVFVFITQTETWVKAGSAIGISVRDYGTFDSMWRALPNVYKTSSLGSVTDDNNNPDLQKFLTLFAISHDLYKTNAELVLKTYDTSIAYAPIIPAMLQQFGLAYESELGLQQARILLRNAVYINTQKGSLSGIKDFIKAFTGYDEETKAGKNIMLSYNDSSFEESLGFWQIIFPFGIDTNALPLNSVALPAEVAPYEEPSSPTLFPNKRSGSLKVLANAINTALPPYTGQTLEIACGLLAPKTRGIPVKEGFSYTFSIYTQAKTVAREITVDIRWFDRNGEELSRAGERTETNTVSSWATRVETTNVAPVNAYFAVPYIRINNVSQGEIHYFDCAQFEQSSEGATEFEEARRINITLKATRVNELKNSSFETVLEPWVADNATLSRDITLSDETNNSAVSLKITPTADGPVKVTHDFQEKIKAGFWYTLSGYVRTGFTGNIEDDLQGHWGFEWFDVNGVSNGISEGTAENLTEFYSVERYTRVDNILTVYPAETTSLAVGDDVRLLGFPESGVDGEYEVTTVTSSYFQVTSSGENFDNETPDAATLVQDLKLDFIVKSYSVLAPDDAVYAKPFFVWDNAEVGQDLNIDSVLFEQSTVAKPYFDGSSGFTSTEDLIWEENQTYVNRSHYYKNRVAAQLRLIEQLPNYLVHGSTFALFLAQPES